MMDFNELPDGFYIKGRLNEDPVREASHRPLKFTIQYKDDDDHTYYYNCVIWGDMADRHMGLKKGMLVCVRKGWGKPDRYSSNKNAVEYPVKEMAVLDTTIVIPEPKVEDEPDDINTFL